MATQHVFGGDWTKEKLDRVRKYLPAYTTIFRGNAYAQRHYKTIYIDAFAGTGSITPGHKRRGKSGEADVTGQSYPNFSIFDGPDEEPLSRATETAVEEAQQLLKGSARIALEVEPPFDRYVFMERSTKRVKELRKLAAEFPQRVNQVETLTGDACANLQRRIETTDWRQWRAVVFLDPYGTQVEWSLLEAIARTKAIDLWLLFPVGMGVTRMLTRNQPPPKKWADRLTLVFGTDEWESEFYQPRNQATGQMNIFDAGGLAEGEYQVEDPIIKTASFDRIAAYFAKRLNTIFAEVAPNPLALMSSTNFPLYLLCFASNNRAAVKIAKYLLKK